MLHSWPCSLVCSSVGNSGSAVVGREPAVKEGEVITYKELKGT